NKSSITTLSTMTFLHNDNWQLKPDIAADFAKATYTPTVDLFASARNHLALAWFSPNSTLQDEGRIADDAFACSWTGYVSAIANPPGQISSAPYRRSLKTVWSALSLSCLSLPNWRRSSPR